MKSKLSYCSTLLPFVLLFAFVACNKADHTDPAVEESVDTSTTNTTLLTSTTTSCLYAPNYGDSILYKKPTQSGDFFVAPLNNSGIDGTWLSWPDGLSMNRTTGVLNLSQSETGVRYNVAFVKKGTTDTCVSQLIIGGMTYLDNIYVISNNDTLAQPVFDANPFKNTICDASNDSDYPDSAASGDSKCAFDNAAPGSKANDQKLRVRTKSGIINLKKSLTDGLFGPVLRNGDFKQIPIQYRLNDASNNAMQSITVKVMYYDKVSSIPAALIQEVTSKRQSFFNYLIINYKPRPPLLIIAGFAN
ncbi:hypothetical protein A3860_35630 [Niastella vici]|uniref:Lipoprotein n=1 Tax=Niastella vici TaxID=1703345 RepID=A0A1V9FNP1_9BACT|nr:hypothetical protein [Niastella vici]OQP59975.1 hypothetical protein A3860_35630 [Niastella vici]